MFAQEKEQFELAFESFMKVGAAGERLLSVTDSMQHVSVLLAVHRQRTGRNKGLWRVQRRLLNRCCTPLLTVPSCRCTQAKADMEQQLETEKEFYKLDAFIETHQVQLHLHSKEEAFLALKDFCPAAYVVNAKAVSGDSLVAPTLPPLPKNIESVEAFREYFYGTARTIKKHAETLNEGEMLVTARAVIQQVGQHLQLLQTTEVSAAAYR